MRPQTKGSSTQTDTRVVTKLGVGLQDTTAFLHHHSVPSIKDISPLPCSPIFERKSVQVGTT